MKITFVTPREELRPYVKSIWVFESPVGMPPSDTNIAAPNGSPKLIINCENTVTSVVAGRVQASSEHGVYFVGNRDCSVLVRTSPGRTCFIGLEFYPNGAYPVLGIPMGETANRLCGFDEILGRSGKEIGEALPALSTIREKTDYIQSRLVTLLAKNRVDNPTVRRCITIIGKSSGLVSITELEEETGYSRRYLEMLFRDHVGFSPKSLAGIFRFQRFYRKWARGTPYDDMKSELYDYYYDQAHFVKEFKRMTGFSPAHFSRNVSNEFGRKLTLQ